MSEQIDIAVDLGVVPPPRSGATKVAVGFSRLQPTVGYTPKPTASRSDA